MGSLVFSAIELNGEKKKKQLTRELLASRYCSMTEVVEDNKEYLELIPQNPFSQLDRQMKHGYPFSFEEAFCGMCYVLAGTNRLFLIEALPYFREIYGQRFDPQIALALGEAFLVAMACKEAFIGLTHEEIAGMSAASLMDLAIRLPFAKEVFEGCGMGGDIGFGDDSRVVKTINVSTLSSFVLASLGIPVVKHGSYCNTSAMGSTEVIEALGANTNQQSKEEIEEFFRKLNFFYADAHWCKTIHDLSHLLMMETVNHIIGPMTPPIAKETVIHRMMGVNEKVHPTVLAKAYEILHQKGFQNIGNVAIVAGLDTDWDFDPLDQAFVKKHAILDELSPYASVVAVCQEGKYVDTFIIRPADFGLEFDKGMIEGLKVFGSQDEIGTANMEALRGHDEVKAAYLAMNAALSLAVFRGDFSVDCFKQGVYTCFKVIRDGSAHQLVQDYAELTGNRR